MVDDVKREEKKEEKKESIFSGITSRKGKGKKPTAAEVDGTENMKEVDELVTAKMVDEPPPEELVKATEEKNVERKIKEPSKTLKTDIDSEKPLYRKSDKFHLAGRPGGVSKYFNR